MRYLCVWAAPFLYFGLQMWKLAAGQAQLAQHANGTETNDSGKMSAARRDGVSEWEKETDLYEMSKLIER